MVHKIKFGKIAVVIFLTVLIWVWADLAQDEELSIWGAAINIARSTNPSIWVSFREGSIATIEKLVLKGPGSKVSEVKRKLKEGLRFELDFDVAQEDMGKAGTYTLKLLPFLQKDKGIKQLGLNVVDCTPDILSVTVVELVKKPLTVKCVDGDQNPVEVASIEPPQVEMSVPADWSGETLVAKVQLIPREKDQARHTPIEKVPFITLGDQTKEASSSVKIRIPAEVDRRVNYTITAVALGFSLSPNMQGKYGVVVTNLDEVIRSISVRATPEAKLAYENMRYQVILEVDDRDKDAKPEELLKRELVYNFPDEYLSRKEITLGQQPVTAQFKLVAVPATSAP